jgi:hypothetical protein
MSNRHVKVINGKKYYYESIRRGKKVTSRYLGPVDRIRKRKRNAAEVKDDGEFLTTQEEQPAEENNYIG